MAYCPEVLESERDVHPLRRRHPRHALRSLAYVRLDQANGGIIRDLTESGMAIQAVAPLQPDQELNLHFELLSPRVRVDARGRVAWSDSGGQGGIQLLGLTPRAQRALRDWLLIQMLSAASVSGRDSMFATVDRELTFSPAGRPAIVVEPEPGGESELLPITWGLFAVSSRSFSIFVDTLVLLCAVLLFSISSIAVMGGLPAWPLTAALLITTSTIFAAVYQVLFSDFLCGATPGKRLAILASAQPDLEGEDPRFR
jgi:PilZ domain-containing protein